MKIVLMILCSVAFLDLCFAEDVQLRGRQAERAFDAMSGQAVVLLAKTNQLARTGRGIQCTVNLDKKGNRTYSEGKCTLTINCTGVADQVGSPEEATCSQE